MKPAESFFALLARYSSYCTAVGFSSALTSAIAALFFLIYAMEAIGFPENSTFLFILYGTAAL